MKLLTKKMKLLKKISLVYTLQIFAVVLIFGYKDALPVNKPDERGVKNASSFEMGKLVSLKSLSDSLLSNKINYLQQGFTGSNW